MWISILNYNSGQIEIADITDFDANIDKDSNIDPNQIAEMWLLSNDYNEGFFNDNEVFDNNVIEEQYTDNWTAVDWFFYGLQVCDLVYRKTRELGWTAQQAREILPLNTKTQVVHTAFVKDWEHWIALRSNEISGKVHPMITELAKQLVKQVYPE